ncbi:MAG: hypothetical protein R2856_19515 [Caldilineaceae bacterium]
MRRSLLLLLFGVLIILASAGIKSSHTVHAQLPPRPTVAATDTPTAAPAPTETAVIPNTPTPVPSVAVTAMPVTATATVAENRDLTPVRIRLSAGTLHNGAWSVVQWQGTDGLWHDVQGWQGTIEGGFKQWRVAPGITGMVHSAGWCGTKKEPTSWA